MFLYGITTIVLIALLFSMWKDNRSLWNPALLVIEVLFLYLSIANAFFSFGYENAHLVMIVGILLIPVLILLSGLFLIVNGFILLKKEGFSKANLLSPIMGIVILFFFVFMWIRVGLVTNDFFFYNPWINILFMFIIYSYIIFDKNQKKFLLQNLGKTIFGQNLPSSLVLGDPIKPKYEGDSVDTVDSGDEESFPNDDEFVAIDKKEMLGYIDKFFTNLIQNKRTFKPGQLPIVTQNNLSIWKILFNDSDYLNYRKQYFIACFGLIFERISTNEFLELLVPLVKNSVSSYSVATLGDDWKENNLISNDLPYGMFGEISKGERFNCQDELYCLAC